MKTLLYAPFLYAVAALIFQGCQPQYGIDTVSETIVVSDNSGPFNENDYVNREAYRRPNAPVATPVAKYGYIEDVPPIFKIIYQQLDGDDKARVDSLNAIAYEQEYSYFQKKGAAQLYGPLLDSLREHAPWWFCDGDDLNSVCEFRVTYTFSWIPTIDAKRKYLRYGFYAYDQEHLEDIVCEIEAGKYDPLKKAREDEAAKQAKEVERLRKLNGAVEQIDCEKTSIPIIVR